jgi:hypothetical protein
MAEAFAKGKNQVISELLKPEPGFFTDGGEKEGKGRQQKGITLSVKETTVQFDVALTVTASRNFASVVIWEKQETPVRGDWKQIDPPPKQAARAPCQGRNENLHGNRL